MPTTTLRERRSPLSLSLAAFLVLVASLFFWLSAFSVPFIKSIYYVKTRANDVKYGTFGWCALSDTVCYQHVGYAWHPQILEDKRLTGSLLLVALTAAFGSLAFLSLLHSIHSLHSGLLSFILTLFTSFVATVSVLLCLVLWGVGHHRFSRDNLRPKYGAALGLVIAGWILFLAAIPLVVIGWFREVHYRHKVVTYRSPNRSV